MVNSTSSRTKDTYGTAWGHWIRFAGIYNFNIWQVTQQHLIYYACWRVKTTKNFGTTIDQQVSAIISVYNKFYTGPNYKFINRKLHWPKLAQFIKSIKKQPGRSDHTPKKIIDNSILLRLVKKLKLNYNGLTLKTLCLFAKFFALRIGDYTFQRKLKRFIKWSQIKIIFHDNLCGIQVTFMIGKHNQVGKVEILTWFCTCKVLNPIICLPCSFISYRANYIEFHGPIRPNLAVFVWNDFSIVTEEDFREHFKNLLLKIKLVPSKYLSPHSFRYGCITDLQRWGVPDWIIKKFARHSPRSTMTFHYTQTTSEEESLNILTALSLHNNNKSNS